MVATSEIDPGRRRGGGLRILLAGASGYIGRHVFRELNGRGHEVVGLVRPAADVRGLEPDDLSRSDAHDPANRPSLRRCELTELDDLLKRGTQGEAFDAVVSCIASRTGGIRDSHAVDYQANRHLLEAARRSGARHFVLLSAICLQHPLLAFQRAKLAFEAELRQADIDWSIVRPTAFFKSLAGQVPRIQAGKPFLIFGPGDGPPCKPISEADLAAYMADCLQEPTLKNRVLPIGGPGPAITPRERGDMLFELSGRRPRFRHLPLSIFDIAEKLLAPASRFLPRLEDKAEFARIGRYYATEPMLALNPETGRYDDATTPEYGEQTLREFYRRVLEEGLAGQELGDQSLF
jgi:divinyl chlorophyllide a 8-vinyl-reductase